VAAVVAGLLAPEIARGAVDPGAPACAAALSLRGDQREVQQLSLSLARYEPRVSAGCRRWAVAIWRTGSQVTVEMEDGQGRGVVRRVSDVNVAAAVVDSWLHEERFPEAVAPPAIAESAAVASLPGRARDAFVVSLGPELVSASDGTGWAGGSLAVCARAGRFCAGAIAEGIVGRQLPGEPGTTRRFAGTLLAALHLPIALGSVTLVPGVGLGAAFVRSHTMDEVPANPTEPTGARTATDWDAIASARLVLAVPLGGRFGLDVGAAFDVALAPHTLALDDGGDPYPMDPRFFLRGGVALRYGQP
jgi:hypothetical protein